MTETRLATNPAAAGPSRARHGGRRTAGWAVFAAGLSASVAGVVLAVHSGQPPADIGQIPAAATAGQASAGPASAGPASSGPGSSGPASNGPSRAAAAASKATAPPTPPAWATPTRVAIGALKVDAPVTAVGVRKDRSLAVPDDPSRLGWWIGSATPGSPEGTVVIAGHVDTAEDGPGALVRLEKLPLGASIKVRAGDRTVEYRAVARRSYAKQRLPADLFRDGTAPRLALITCGGTFQDGTYSHNVVVYAEPA